MVPMPREVRPVPLLAMDPPDRMGLPGRVFLTAVEARATTIKCPGNVGHHPSAMSADLPGSGRGGPAHRRPLPQRLRLAVANTLAASKGRLPGPGDGERLGRAAGMRIWPDGDALTPSTASTVLTQSGSWRPLRCLRAVRDSRSSRSSPSWGERCCPRSGIHSHGVIACSDTFEPAS